jgi:hypothetical protein
VWQAPNRAGWNNRGSGVGANPDGKTLNSTGLRMTVDDFRMTRGPLVSAKDLLTACMFPARDWQSRLEQQLVASPFHAQLQREQGKPGFPRSGRAGIVADYDDARLT